MKFVGIIPARYASTRFPGKPLAMLGGKPVIQRVYEQVKECFDELYVATDDNRIKDAVLAFGGNVVMTSPDCNNGTERCLDAYKRLALECDVIVNIQGDEPLIEPEIIEKLARVMLDDAELQMGTLCYPISAEQAQNPNLVKVVRAHNDNALYFSRSPIPFARSGGIEPEYFGHIGMYAYRRQFLLDFGKLPYSKLENTEKLEQLRVLEAGIAIRCLTVDAMAPGVDTPEDLEAVRRIIAERGE